MTLMEDGVLSVSVDVMNEGARAGEETLFLFIHDKVASVTRPLLELKSFTKIMLAPGARDSVTWTLKGADLRFPEPELKPLFSPARWRFCWGRQSIAGCCW